MSQAHARSHARPDDGSDRETPGNGEAQRILSRRVALAVLAARANLLWERLWPALLPFVCVAALFCTVSWLGVWPAFNPYLRMAIVAATAVVAIASLYPLLRVKLPTRSRPCAASNRQPRCAIARYRRCATRCPARLARKRGPFGKRTSAAPAAPSAVSPPARPTRALPNATPMPCARSCCWRSSCPPPSPATPAWNGCCRRSSRPRPSLPRRPGSTHGFPRPPTPPARRCC